MAEQTYASIPVRTRQLMKFGVYEDETGWWCLHNIATTRFGQFYIMQEANSVTKEPLVNSEVLLVLKITEDYSIVEASQAEVESVIDFATDVENARPDHELE